MIRVALFAPLRFFRPILQPVGDALDGRADVRITGDRSTILYFRPHVLVQAAAEHLEYFRVRLPDTVIGSVRHGLVSKGYARRLPERVEARRFDFVCVGDAEKARSDARAGATAAEYWYTGYPQLDPLFRELRGAMPVGPRSSRSILFAPTWNLGLSAAPLLDERLLGALLEAPVSAERLVIKPHPNIAAWRPGWMRGWARLAERDPRVQLVADADTDVVHHLAAADVLISDASSVIFEFLALDRPIVLVTSPAARFDPAYDPDDIIWRWRDVGEEVHDVGALPAAVARALTDRGLHGAARRTRAQALFGDLRDGHAAERIAERILALESRIPAEIRVVRPTAGQWSLSQRRHDLRLRLATSARARRLFLSAYEDLRLARRRRSGLAGPIPTGDMGAGPLPVGHRDD